MTKPPIKKTTQEGYVQVKVRLPPSVHRALTDDALRNGHSLNAEVLARLQESPLDDVKRQNEEIKRMIRQLLDRT